MLVESVGYCWVGSRIPAAVRTLMVGIFFTDDNGDVEGEFFFPALHGEKSTRGLALG
jgi:hypothetical protein